MPKQPAKEPPNTPQPPMYSETGIKIKRIILNRCQNQTGIPKHVLESKIKNVLINNILLQYLQV